MSRAGQAFSAIAALGAILWSPSLQASPQNALDRGDPSIVQHDLPRLPGTGAQDQVVPGTTVSPAGHDLIRARSLVAGAILVAGAPDIAPATFAPIIEPYVGRPLTPDDLKALTGQIAGVARGKGFLFATAWIPAQAIRDGLLRIHLDEGRIDEVRIVGTRNRAVRRILDSLVNGKAIRREVLERYLLVAGDVEGVRLRDPQFTREGERGILTVHATQDRIFARGTVDNRGDHSIGPVRARMQVDLNGIISGDDQLSLQAVTVPTTPREFGFAAATYNKLVGGSGTELTASAYYAHTDPSGYLRDIGNLGRSVEASIGVNRPVLRRRTASIWLSTDLDIRRVRQSYDDRATRRDRLTTVHVSANGFVRFADTVVRGSVVLTQGLGLFDATSATDDDKSRSDGSARFTKAEAWGDATTPLAGPVSLRVAFDAQVASRPLLSSEEIGLGGPRFLRGYDYSERSGDGGVMGSLEIRYDLKNAPKPLERTQLYLFSDAGDVSNRRGGAFGGSLASAGGGVRIGIGPNLDLGGEIAVPLSGPRYESGSRAPRFSFSVTGRL